MEKIVYNILNILEESGYEAYLVGGYVRDYLIRKKTKDIDICTNARPKDMIKIFNNEKISLLEYGNVLLELGDYEFEITTFRKDLDYLNNRKPKEIIYVDSLEEDIVRRDFTINSICMNKDKKIIDLLNGRRDLSRRIIKTIGDAEVRFKEDALRMMRAIRFAVVLNFKLDDSIKNAIKKNKELLRNLSYERKKEELNKIFSSGNKKYAIKLIRELELEEVLEINNLDLILLTNDLLGIWSMITNVDYAFTKSEKDLIKIIKTVYELDVIDNYALYKYGIYSVGIVCDLKKMNKKKMVSRYEKLLIHDRKDINIDSDLICDILNKKPGKFLKDIYYDLENKILVGKLNNNKEEIIKYIKENYDIIND